MGATKYDWSKADLLLGTMPDRQLGELFGIPQTSVYRRRRSRGIPAYNRRGIAHRYEGLIGKVPDNVLARYASVSVDTARKWRTTKGINSQELDNKERLQAYLVRSFMEPYQQYVWTPCGLIDVLTDTRIYSVKFDLSTEEAHRAIGELLTFRSIKPNRELTIACRRATTTKEIVWAIEELGIEIITLDKRVSWD